MSSEREPRAKGALTSVQLVTIGRSGLPGDPCPQLDEVAKGVCAATAALYEKVGFVLPWVGYLVLSDDRIIGTCAFKGPPTKGEVEIAYFNFPGFEGRGFATRMARDLLAMARATEPCIIVWDWEFRKDGGGDVA